MSSIRRTGRTREGKCEICGQRVTIEEIESLDGYYWPPLAHRAPCGAHCIGGEVAVGESDVHIGESGTCPRCGEVDSAAVEIMANTNGTERLVFRRYTPNFRPELGFRIVHEVRGHGEWMVDNEFCGDEESLNETKRMAAVYYPWLREMLDA